VAAVLTIGRYVIILIGVLIVLGALDFDLASLAVVGEGLGVGIGFGLQKTVSNFTSGIVPLFEQSLRSGDLVEVDGILGKVDRSHVRATVVRTLDNVELTIPNETLFTSTVTNYTQSSKITRVMIIIGVSYDTDPEEVMEALLQAAQAHELVMEDPEPVVHFLEYADSSLNFRLAIWLDDPDYRLQVPSELHLAIWKEFEKRDIEIPFPQHDLHIRTGLPG
jgi:small-conductance mechanosensitive channel